MRARGPHPIAARSAPINASRRGIPSMHGILTGNSPLRGLALPRAPVSPRLATDPIVETRLLRLHCSRGAAAGAGCGAGINAAKPRSGLLKADDSAAVRRRTPKHGDPSWR